MFMSKYSPVAMLKGVVREIEIEKITWYRKEKKIGADELF